MVEIPSFIFKIYKEPTRDFDFQIINTGIPIEVVLMKMHAFIENVRDDYCDKFRKDMLDG